MQRNPYESKKSRRDRIISNILIVFFVISFFWGLYQVFIGTRKNITTYEFTECSAQLLDDSSQNDEFDSLFNYALTMDGDTIMDEAFSESFPISSALLNMQKDVYSDKAPYFCIDSNRLVLAQTVLSETADCRELEVMMATVSTNAEDNTVSVSMSDFIVYTVVYNARSGVLSYKDYEQSQFHVNLFSLSAVAKGGRPTECTYDIALGGSGFDEAKCKQIVYDPINATYGDPEVEIKRTRAVITAVQKDDALADTANEAIYSVKTADGLFAKIQEVNMTFTFEKGATPTVSFVANR